MKTGDTMIHTRVLRRARILSLVLVVLLVGLLVRVLWLQTVNYDRYQAKVIEQMTTTTTVNAKRGNLYDRNGILIATNISTYRIFISPSEIQTAQKKADEAESGAIQYAALIAEGLASYLGSYGVTYDGVLKQTTYTNYLDRTIARNVDEDTADTIAAYVSENGLGRMVYLEATNTRYYPYSTLASHLIGFTGSDGTGLYGLEYEYEETLSGSPGKYVVARDAKGNEMPYAYEQYIEAVDGYDHTLTIDVYIQSALEEQVEAAYKEHGGQSRACGIVMDPNTGAILAMAVYPSYDLNHPRELTEEDTQTLLATGLSVDSDEYMTKKSELLLSCWSNKSIAEAYVPGSTFKIITSAMALEEQVVRTSETFTCSGALLVGSTLIHCHKTLGHGTLTFAGGIQQSCNPILMTVGLRLGTERFYEYFSAFGYLERTGVDLPGEGYNVFYKPDSFTTLNLATSSFGQNFKVTALSHLTAICAVANGGNLVTPYVVERITDSEGKTVKSHETEIKRQVVSRDVCDTLSSILEEGVSGDGGASNAYVAGYRIAAKTGTSEKVGDNRDAYICSCVAYAPAEAPEVAALIMVDEPTEGSLFGSTVAAPYIAALMETILPYMGVETSYTEQELENLAVTVPNLLSYTREQAEARAYEMEFDVEIVGDGNYIMAQTPAGGTKMERKNAKVILYTGDERPVSDITVPDVLGKSAAAANEILIEAGLNLRIVGTSAYLSGTDVTVAEQSPVAGTAVEAGSVVTLTFVGEGGTE